ncbi:transcriptional regulator [Aeromicrobium flavum]|uniref:Transcriptional regulator n=1 Tax=Aeromicrobium flavum TaxID=416568 RepID=A0A512HWM2_9ACTN|nr:transcriptional regulator [Aeromicrobium flavum]
MLIVLVLAVGLALVAALLSGAWLQRQLGGQVERLPSAMPTGDRPEPTEAMNILLMGSDKRKDGSVAGQRSDTLMVLNVAEDRKSVSVVGIPRDSWVQVPGLGPSKINAAFADGGPALAVETVEKLTNVRIDHVGVIDWEGFKALTDALGGVPITIPETVRDGSNGRTWEKGTQRMDGKTALAYVRQRYGLAGGDLDRIKRQQNFMRALMNQTLSRQTFTNPRRLYDVLDAVTDNLAVDEDLTTGDMRNLAWSLRSIRSSDVKFTTVPVKGTGMEGAQSVVYLDRPAGDELWQAVREDKAAEWIDATDSGLQEKVN